MERAEIVWLGRDNPIARELLADDVPMDLSSVTRYLLTLSNGSNTVIVDSAATPGVFATVGAVVQMRLGMQSISSGKYQARLSMFTASTPNGIAFERFHLEVKAP